MSRTSELKPLLLDTHIWLWVVQGNNILATGARNTISSAASSGSLRIAAMTMWEIAMLSSRNRITLDKPAGVWLDEAVTASGVAVEPLSVAVAAESCNLPSRFHADPADRMIVATARVTKALLMTRDRRILEYAARGHLSAIGV